MTITLELEPEVEERLQATAARRGISLADYIQEVLHNLAERESSALSTGTGSVKRSILEFEGLGADLWRRELAGQDAQDYISEMREKEWEHRI